MAAKKIPQRMCVGCRTMRDKKALIRVVRTVTGTVELDATGKKSGRGAYLCPQAACFARAKKSRAIERALDVKIGEELYLALEKEIAALEAAE